MTKMGGEVAKKSFFVNIAFQAHNYSSSKTRFAFELYLTSHGNNQGARIFSSRFIDDQYTPGRNNNPKVFLFFL